MLRFYRSLAPLVVCLPCLCFSAGLNRVRLPALFVPATDGAFSAWGAGAPAMFTPAGQIRWRGVSLVFEGANASVRLEGSNPIEGKFNFIGGPDGRTGVPAYRALAYRSLYTGVDLILRYEGARLKFEYHVAPGANPDAIRFRYPGASVHLDSDGALAIHAGGVSLHDATPRIFDSAGNPVAGRFTVDGTGLAGFSVGPYDPTRELIVDPALVYTAEFNGNQDAAATCAAVDPHGALYVAGYTSSSDFPVSGAIQPYSGGGDDAFVLKLNAQGTELIYATYLGGAGQDQALAMAVDAAGEVVVAGETASTNFPLVSAAQPSPGGGTDAFVAKLNASGNALIFSTFLGGSGTDIANGVALDPAGDILIAGDTTSTNFPTFMAYQPGSAGRQDAFVVKLDPSGVLIYSTLLGGSSDDHAGAIAADAFGNAYITGSTYSSNFPVASPFQAHNAGGQDAFVTKLNSTGSALIFSTYLGGSGGFPGAPETGSGIGVDPQNNVYVAGTTSSMNFPVQNPIQTAHGYGTDVFLTKFNPSGSALVYSTYLGGSSYDFCNTLLVDASGDAYLAGQTTSWDLPAVNAFQSGLAGGIDAFAIKVNALGALDFSSYLGGSGNDSASGIALDHLGNLHIVGQTESPDFPHPTGISPEAVGPITAFAASWTTVGDHTPLLNRYYQGFFNRAPDPVGLETWTGTLDSGMPTAQLAVMFFDSGEFFSTGLLIGAAYLGIDGQNVPYASYNTTLTQFHAGTLATQACLAGPPPDNTVGICSQLGLIQTLMSSSYFQTTYGGLSNTQLVTAAYQNLFNQTPSQSTVAQWVGQLNSGLTEAQFFQSMLNLPQYTAIVTNPILVDLCYFVFLFRNPDPIGYQTWLAQLNAGMTQQQLFANFVNSPEFLGDL